jgi:ketosteroid isomerase-like protein
LSEAEVRKLEDERFKAMAAGDVAALERLLGDGLVYTHSSASVDTKASLIDGIRTKKFTYQGFERPVEEIHVYGDSAVVGGHARIDLGTRQLNVRYTAVWAKQGGEWRFVAWQSTPIPA